MTDRNRDCPHVPEFMTYSISTTAVHGTHGFSGKAMSSKQHKTRRKRRADAPAEEDVVVQAPADMTSCEQVRQLFIRCRRTIKLHGECVRVDLKNVSQADTKLMACLVAVYQLARDASVRLELSPSNSILSLAEVCRLGWLIERTAPRVA
jgi:ABC-type transporter Mla MlaB component